MRRATEMHTDDLFDRQEVVFHITGRNLRQLILLAIESAREESDIRRPAEMCTRQVQQHLLEKGFKCSSKPGLHKLIDRFGLQPIRRGKENWYKRAEVEAISPRTINHK